MKYTLRKYNKEQFTDSTRQPQFMCLGGQLVLQIGRCHGLLQVTNVGGEIQLHNVHRWLIWSSKPIGKWRRLYLVQAHQRIQWWLLEKCFNHIPLHTYGSCVLRLSDMLIQARLQSEPVLRGKRVDTSRTQNEALSHREGEHSHAIGVLTISTIKANRLRNCIEASRWQGTFDDVIQSGVSWKTTSAGGGTREGVGHICLLWLLNGICVRQRRGDPGVDWLQFKMNLFWYWQSSWNV